jgi:hypothetical protein
MDIIRVSEAACCRARVVFVLLSNVGASQRHGQGFAMCVNTVVVLRIV